MANDGPPSRDPSQLGATARNFKQETGAIGTPISILVWLPTTTVRLFIITIGYLSTTEPSCQTFDHLPIKYLERI